MTAKQAEVAELREQGLTYREIAKRLGLGFSAVYQRAVLAGVERQRYVTDEGTESERPRSARARIQSEVAAGKRCSRCWLLLPCADHQP
jgi:transposase